MEKGIRDKERRVIRALVVYEGADEKRIVLGLRTLGKKRWKLHGGWRGNCPCF